MGIFGNLFDNLFDCSPVVVKEAEIDRDAAPAKLFPEEEQVLTKAVQKRRVEFSLGRTLAREALQVLGMDNIAIPVNDDRSPKWPASVVGAITHCNSWCVAGVALSKNVQYLGLDVEEYLLRKLDAGMIEYICGPREREWLSAFSGDTHRRAAMAIFSAKESWYKACYPDAQCFLDFKGAHIDFDIFDEEHCKWRGVLLKDWGPFKCGQEFPFGQSGFDDRYVASAFVKLNDGQ